MRGSYTKSLLIAVAALGLAGPLSTTAQISVTASGAGPFNFAVSPPSPANFATLGVGTASATYEAVAPFDTQIMTTAATAVTGALGTSATVPPSTFATARHNTTLLRLQTHPTGVDYTLLMMKLMNDAGSDITEFRLTYDYGMENVPAVEMIPGYRVFFSVTGLAGSWQLLPSLSGHTVSTPGDTELITGISWPAGTVAYVLWADDNSLPNLDQANTIDNVLISGVVAGTPQPPAIVSQPAATNVLERQVAGLHAAATGAGLSYQWYKEPGATLIPGATSPSYTVTNRLGTSRYPWSNPSDSGTYFVRVSGTAGPTVESMHVAVNVTADTTAPTLVRAFCGPGADDITLTLSEALNNESGDAVDQFLWEVRAIDGTGLAIGLANNATYTDDGTSTTMVLTLDTSITVRDPNKGYKLVRLAGNPALDTAKTANALAAESSVPILCFTNEIFGLIKAWQYNDKDVDPGATWVNVGFDDVSGPWATGTSPFDAKRDGGVVGPDGLDDCRAMTLYGLGAVGTCLSLATPATSTPPLTNLATVYFRTHFSFAGNPATATLELKGKIDDGAIFYINGTEVGRIRVAAGVIPHASFSGSPTTVGDAEAQDIIPLVNLTSLVVGDNVLAVELKQGNITSSDLTMGLSLSVLEATPGAVHPVLTISYSGGHPTISWSPAGGTLQFKHNLTDATWTDIGAATTPYTDLASPGDHGFYQVKVP